ncbi:hypothetical protein SEA_STUFF_5 [Streptomyces phage Stuff]|nr:hypothetical protein SEA_STUFF_5 [Streptomyces phage Stuff]
MHPAVMTEREAQKRLADVEALACEAREKGSALSPWTVIQICEGRVSLPEKVRPLPHDRPDLQEPAAG